MSLVEISQLFRLYNFFNSFLKSIGLVGQIGYALVPMVARGAMLGPDQPVILHMLDIPPAAEALSSYLLLCKIVKCLSQGAMSCYLLTCVKEFEILKEETSNIRRYKQ